MSISAEQLAKIEQEIQELLSSFDQIVAKSEEALREIDILTQDADQEQLILLNSLGVELRNRQTKLLGLSEDYWKNKHAALALYAENLLNADAPNIFDLKRIHKEIEEMLKSSPASASLTDIFRKVESQISHIEMRESLISRADSGLLSEKNRRYKDLIELQREIESFIENTGDQNERLHNAQRRVQGQVSKLAQSYEKQAILIEKGRETLKIPGAGLDKILQIKSALELELTGAFDGHRREIEELIAKANDALGAALLDKAQKLVSQGDIQQSKQLLNHYEALPHARQNSKDKITREVNDCESHFGEVFALALSDVKELQNADIQKLIQRNAELLKKYPMNSKLLEIQKTLSAIGNKAYETARSLFTNIEFIPELPLKSQLQMLQEAQRQVLIAKEIGSTNLSLILPLEHQIDSLIAKLEKIAREMTESPPEENGKKMFSIFSW